GVAGALQCGDVFVGDLVGVTGDLVDVGREGGGDGGNVLTRCPKRSRQRRAPQLGGRVTGRREHAVHEPRGVGGIAPAQIADCSNGARFEPVRMVAAFVSVKRAGPLARLPSDGYFNRALRSADLRVRCRRAGAWHWAVTSLPRTSVV